ncbi:MAG: glycosyltransferase [Fibrobacterota bacterium]
MKNSTVFRDYIRKEFKGYIKARESRVPSSDVLKVDLHCHDHNSDRPEERIGRILNAPETWLPTDLLIKTLKDHDITALTVTNHNNARTCYELQDKGHDILTAAEFDCNMPEYKTCLHVLTYGFTPEQESVLNVKRQDIYEFAEYTSDQNLPTVLAHPLYFKNRGKIPGLEMMDKLGLMFERFEVINGQRDTWQNLLVAKWLESMDEESINETAARTGIDPGRYCRNPYRKTACGGSDDHMGIFAGLTGTYLSMSGLDRIKKEKSSSEALLEALRNGETIPFGNYTQNENLNIALLDYFCQCVLNLKDPGLLRIMLHKGSEQDKVLSFAIVNAVHELRRHKYTSKFLRLFHLSMHGKKTNLIDRLMVGKSTRPLLKEISNISSVRRKDPKDLPEQLIKSVDKIFEHLVELAKERISKKASAVMNSNPSGEDFMEIFRKIELPSYLRKFGREKEKAGEENNDSSVSSVDAGRILDGLSFPVLAAGLINSVFFATANVMYNKRLYLNEFSGKLGKYQQPERVLWLTDTFGDHNGVSMSLRNILKEVQEKDYPLDFLVCSNDCPEEPHLKVFKPVAEFTLPVYKNQVFRVPNIPKIQEFFYNKGYDRIICSTELFMGAVAQYLKHAFNVPAWFFVHTDWMEFAEKTMKFNDDDLSRLKRMMRIFYNSFDGLFVLNSENRDFLSGHTMKFPGEKIHVTKHWVNRALFYKRENVSKKVFPGVSEEEQVILYTGRISHEKGVFELPGICRRAAEKSGKVKCVIIGKGPALSELKKAFPEGIFIDWIPQEKLPEMYSAADLFVLPSTFDTFGRVVLEALSCGLPVCAYNTKGPRDIIGSSGCGFLAGNAEELKNGSAGLLRDAEGLRHMGDLALKRAEGFEKEKIFPEILARTGLTNYNNKKNVSGYSRVKEETGKLKQQEVIPDMINA